MSTVQPTDRRISGRLTVPVAKDSVSFSICPETFYGMAMRLLVAGFVISGIITFGFVKPDMTDDPVLNVYGVVNACITFDYYPAGPIMSVIWVFVCFCLIAYVILFIYRLQVHFKPDSRIIKVSKPLGALFVLLFCSMSMTMVITPSTSVKGHTLPYQALILGTVIWWIYNAIIIENWPTPFRTRVKRFWRTATVVYVFVSLMKIYIQWVLMEAFDRACEKDCGADGSPACEVGCWDEEMQKKYVPPAKALYDPIWMLLFVFHRYWNPLHSTNVILTLANDTRHNVPGDANVCCFHFVPRVHGDEGEKENGQERESLLDKVVEGNEGGEEGEV